MVGAPVVVDGRVNGVDKVDGPSSVDPSVVVPAVVDGPTVAVVVGP